MGSHLRLGDLLLNSGPKGLPRTCVETNKEDEEWEDQGSWLVRRDQPVCA